MKFLFHIISSIEFRFWRFYFRMLDLLGFDLTGLLVIDDDDMFPDDDDVLPDGYVFEAADEFEETDEEASQRDLEFDLFIYLLRFAFLALLLTSLMNILAIVIRWIRFW